MSNLDLWYCAGIAVLGASFSYIVFSAMQFMGVRKKEEKSSSAEDSPEHAPSTQFLRNSLMAFVGIMIGSQLLQYHQDQQELSKQSIAKDMAVLRAMAPKAAAVEGDKAVPQVGGAPVGLGPRPTSRPQRGSFSSDVASPEVSSPLTKVTPGAAHNPLALASPIVLAPAAPAADPVVLPPSTVASKSPTALAK